MGDKHAAQGNQSGRQVWKTSVEDKCKLMQPKAPRVGDKCGRQVGDKCKIMQSKAPRMKDKGGGQVEDKCKLTQPKAPRVGDKWETSGTSVAQGTQSGRQVWEISVGDKCRRQV